MTAAGMQATMILIQRSTRDGTRPMRPFERRRANGQSWRKKVVTTARIAPSWITTSKTL